MSDYLHRSARALARAEREHLEPPDELDAADDSCAHPGRYGCGRCAACDAWAEREADRALDDPDPPPGWDY